MATSGEHGKLSVTDFAKLIGVAVSTVSHAIKAGRLVKSLSLEPNGKYLIDAAVGRIEFDENKKKGARKGQQFEARRSAAEGNASDSVVDHERRLKHYQAELARVKFEELAGALVKSDDVKRQAFKIARAVRDSMMNIPGKISAELAGETDQFKIHARLDEEIRQALENLSSEITAEPEIEEAEILE